METAKELLIEHLGPVIEHLGGSAIEVLGPRESAGTNPFAHLPTLRCMLPGNLELLVCYNEQYPLTPPVFIATVDGSDSQGLPLRWDLSLPAADRLRAALDEYFCPPGPYAPVFGVASRFAMTRRRGIGKQLGLDRFYSGRPVLEELIEGAIFERSTGLVEADVVSKAVLVAGLGSGGSYVANLLCRAGVGRFVLVDGDVVEPANLVRSTYEASDIGEKKSTALCRQLLRIRPSVEVVEYPHTVQAFPDAKALMEVTESVDLVLALTDDPHAQMALNRISYGAGKPAIFAGLYAKAEGGEVILSVPGVTPCYSCSTGHRRDLLASTGLSVDRNLDYGTSRLSGEAALGCDIQHIDSVTVKTALGLLGLEGDSQASRFVRDALEQSLSYYIGGMVPDFYFFPTLFRYGEDNEVPGQYAYQSAWLTPASSADCPVCGESPRDPLSVPLQRGPRLPQG